MSSTPLHDQLAAPSAMAPPSPLSLLLVLSTATLAIAKEEPNDIVKPQLLADPINAELQENASVMVEAMVATRSVSRRLRCAHAALRAWKRTIRSDPHNFTGNWEGPDVCSYNGVFCAQALDDASSVVVAGIDLNGANIVGRLPSALGLMRDLSLLHINSNRFRGRVPITISRFRLIHELDLSNNRLRGPFPTAVLSLPNLRYLDLRYNRFCGPIPPAVFDKPLDALFLNHNRFSGPIPPNIGNSTVSVAVLAHNNLSGRLPSTIAHMAPTLEELLLLHNDLSGCIPDEVGFLGNATVIDLSHNSLLGSLPDTLSGLLKVEELDVGHNALVGEVPASVCRLPSLLSFSFSHNYFSKWAEACVDSGFNVRDNCFSGQAKQRGMDVCLPILRNPRVDCEESKRDVGFHLPLRLLVERQTSHGPSTTKSSNTGFVSLRRRMGLGEDRNEVGNRRSRWYRPEAPYN